MNKKISRYLTPACTALIVSACVSQNPAPVVDGNHSGTASLGMIDSSPAYIPNPPANSSSYGTSPYPAPNNTSTLNVGTNEYPIQTDRSVYTPSTSSNAVANNPIYTPPSTVVNNNPIYTPSNMPLNTPTNPYVGNYAPVDSNATYHTVVAGDTIYNIAKRYGISQENLRTWNGLTGDNINKGQRLRVKSSSYSNTTHQSTRKPVISAANGSQTHRVVAGDTVYNIAKRYGISEQTLRSLNRLSGNDIKINQILKISDKTNAGANKNHSITANNVYTPPVKPSAATTMLSEMASTHSQKDIKSDTKTFQFNDITWQSPLNNSKIAQNFTEQTRHVKLIGTAGQTFHSAADGEVIFSGQGPRGYGNLVIVQHSKQYLSAYGNTQSLMVKESQRVKRGDILGTLKNDGNLLFEVRENGQALDPLSFMQL